MMADEPLSRPSTFLFPLRTNVEYFASEAGSLTLRQRIRQASLLYDTLLFEGGVYMSTVGPSGSVDWWLPPSEVTETILEEKWEPTGGDHVFGVSTTQDGEYTPVISGPVERRFRAEFHSVLKELGAHRLSWLRMDTFGLTDEGKKLLGNLREEDKLSLEHALPGASPFLRSMIIKNLNHDLLVTAALGTSASIDPLYAPLLHQKAKYRKGFKPAAGFLALGVSVPNMADVPWEAIVEIREDPAMIAFRTRLVELEAFAKAALPEGEAHEVEQYVSQLMLSDLLAELWSRWPSLSQVAMDVGLDLLIGSLLGPASVLATGVRGVVDLQDARLSWVTAFLRLKKAGGLRSAG